MTCEKNWLIVFLECRNFANNRKSITGKCLRLVILVLARRLHLCVPKQNTAAICEQDG